MKKINKILSLILIGILLSPSNTLALTKEETVYTNLSSDGTIIKSVVNNHLTVEEEGLIDDETRLKDILNLNGKEKFNLDNQKLTWEANNKDIFYQGVSAQELPIEVKVTYYLDDEEKKVEDIIGKEGNVTIKIDLKNNSYDSDRELYTPFVVTMGTILSNDIKNIEITNGRIVNTGNRTLAVAIASPGLYENIGLEEFQSLNTIELRYYTKKFTEKDIYLIATPKLLSDSDLDIFDKLDTITSGVHTIQDNMDKIEEGAANLEQGSQELKNGTNEISTSLNKALESISQLENGSKTIDSSLEQVITELNNVQTMLQDKDIEGSLANLYELKDNNTKAISKLTPINETVSKICNDYGISDLPTNISSNEELIQYLIDSGISEEQIEQLFTTIGTYTGDFCTGTSSLIELLNYNNLAIDSMITSLTDLSNQVSELLTTLNDALSQIKTGTSNVSNGLTELNTGINKLYQGSVEINTGMENLSNGTTTLKEGISQLNTQGINELNTMADKLEDYEIKVKNLEELSKEYKGFSSDNATDTVFIYKLK